jgi:hypothetical protein
MCFVEDDVVLPFTSNALDFVCAFGMKSDNNGNGTGIVVRSQQTTTVSPSLFCCWIMSETYS